MICMADMLFLWMDCCLIPPDEGVYHISSIVLPTLGPFAMLSSLLPPP